MGRMRFAKIFVLALIFGQINQCFATKRWQDADNEMRRALDDVTGQQTQRPVASTERYMAPTVSSSARTVPPRSQQPQVSTIPLPREQGLAAVSSRILGADIEQSRVRRDAQAQQAQTNPGFLVSSPSSRSLRPASAESLSSEISGFRMSKSAKLDEDTQKLLGSMDGYMGPSDVQAIRDLHAIPVGMDSRLLQRKVSVLLNERPITDKEAEAAEFNRRAEEESSVYADPEANRRQQLIFKHRAAMANLEAEIVRFPLKEGELNKKFESYFNRISKLRTGGYEYLRID